MAQKYEAPKVTLYGSVAALTGSFKCTSGTDLFLARNSLVNEDPDRCAGPDTNAVG